MSMYVNNITKRSTTNLFVHLVFWGYVLLFCQESSTTNHRQGKTGKLQHLIRHRMLTHSQYLNINFVMCMCNRSILRKDREEYCIGVQGRRKRRRWLSQNNMDDWRRKACSWVAVMGYCRGASSKLKWVGGKRMSNLMCLMAWTDIGIGR